MDVDTFWQIIEATHRESGGDNQKQFDLLVELLAQEAEETIVTFEHIFITFREQAYNSELWAAASFINCGCGEDGFSDFRAWLVAQGKATFEKVLINPDNLADIVQPDTRLETRFESFSYVIYDAYYQKTGLDERPDIFDYPPIDFIEKFHQKDEYPALFPRLTAKLKDDCDELWKRYFSKSRSDNEL